MVQAGRRESLDKFQPISCQLPPTPSWDVGANVGTPYENSMESQLTRPGVRHTDMHGVAVGLGF
jgi:hypothetical protein